VNFFSLALMATGAFISTDIDDLFLLVGFFSDRSFSRLSIFTGQILGIATLVAISLAAAFAALAISPAHAGLLGVAPLVIGIGKLLLLRKTEEEGQPTAVGVLQVAAITIVNGGTPEEIIATIAIFGTLTILWCFAAWWLVRRTALGKPLRRYGHVVLPFILIGLGLLIIYRSGAFRLAASW
jgi:cadmium resistance protein CadD (predicted permease)